MKASARNAASTTPAAARERACSDSGRATRARSGVFGLRVVVDRVVAALEREAVTTAAHRLDRLDRVVRIELAAQTADEHLEHVRIAVEVLLVDVLGQVGLRDELAGVQHEVFE